MVEISEEDFEDLVATAYEELPAEMTARLENVEVLIQDQPPGELPRLFGLYSGRPLTSHEVILESIAATTTRTGLRVKAELDINTYPSASVSATRRWRPCL